MAMMPTPNRKGPQNCFLFFMFTLLHVLIFYVPAGQKEKPVMFTFSPKLDYPLFSIP